MRLTKKDVAAKRIINNAAARFDARPLYRASIEARAELAEQTVTDEQIRDLRNRADARGDLALVYLCCDALQVLCDEPLARECRRSALRPIPLRRDYRVSLCQGAHMSWSNYLQYVSANLPIPARFGVDDDNGIPCVYVELTVRDHEGGETITVKTRRSVQPLAMLTAHEAAEVVRDLLRIAICHEIDEAIVIDGERPFNPHRTRKGAGE